MLKLVKGGDEFAEVDGGKKSIDAGKVNAELSLCSWASRQSDSVDVEEDGRQESVTRDLPTCKSCVFLLKLALNAAPTLLTTLLKKSLTPVAFVSSATSLTVLGPSLSPGSAGSGFLSSTAEPSFFCKPDE